MSDKPGFADVLTANVKDVHFIRHEGRDDAVLVVPKDGDICTIFHAGIVGHAFWKAEAERWCSADYAAQEGF